MQYIIECVMVRSYFYTFLWPRRVAYSNRHVRLSVHPSVSPSIIFMLPEKIQHKGAALSVRPSVSPSVRPSVRTSHLCPALNCVIWSRISKLFNRNDHHVGTTCRAQYLVPTLKVKITARPCSKIVSGPYLCFLKSDFENISQKWSPYWVNVSRLRFRSLPWRSRSQHGHAAKSCPANNFVI